MADENQKTETIGHIPAEKARTLKGWSHYEKVAKELTAARDAATKAKKAIRDQLQSKYGEGVDFNVDGDGRMTVYRNLQNKSKRPRGKDLSGDF